MSPGAPAFTVALGVALLGDPLGPRKLIGGAAVVAGAVVLPLLGSGAEPPAVAPGAGAPEAPERQLPPRPRRGTI